MDALTILLMETDEGREADLEEVVDLHGLGTVLGILAEVCHAKGAHLDHAWDDTVAASRWAGAASEIEELAENQDYPFRIQ